MSISKRGIRPGGRAAPWAFVSAVFVLRALQLRGRAAKFRALPHESGETAEDPDYELITVEGARVDPSTLAAATALARREGLSVLELVPAAIDAERALDVLRAVDPDDYRYNRLTRGQGAAQVLLVTPDVVERAGGPPPSPVREAELIPFLAEAKRCAPDAADVVVAGGIDVPANDAEGRRASLRVLSGGAFGLAATAPLVGLAWLAAGVVVAPFWGIAALAAWCAQPALALRGTVLDGARNLRGADRPLHQVRRAVRVLRASDPVAAPPLDEETETRTVPTAEEVAGFFEERRDTCPWCDSERLVPHIVATDTIQAKPGTFHLERCEACGHIFQNPRLSLEGLDFYYADFYEGEGADQLAGVFESSPRPYLGRAELARRHLPAGYEPEAWLDVGTGHAHFCLMAGTVFPNTRFDALDLGAGVEVAERRGWVTESFKGLFPEVADELGPRYDVVSMHHYMEHTREPLEEIEAASRALRPGGHLLIELPDPESWAGRVLGRWWGPWFQPQHQHLIPIGNLCKALEAQGFEVVATERREAHQPVELAMGTWMLLSSIGPVSGMWWQEKPSRLAGPWRWAVLIAGSPLLIGALVVDRITGPLVAATGSNGYRVLARWKGELGG